MSGGGISSPADAENMHRIETLVKSGASRVDLERNQFGFDYAQVGEELQTLEFPR